MARRWLDLRSARQGIPFAAAAVVGLGLAALHPEPPLLNVVLAAALLATLIACPLLFRWARLPAPTAVLPPLAFLLVVGLLRADNGTGTGFGALALLPVFWVALFGRRWQLLVVLGGVAALFALPLAGVVGDGYAAPDLRTAVIWVAVSTLVGLTVQGLVSREREQRRSLARQNAFLDAIFAAAGALVAVLEPDGRVSRVNRACEKVSGFAGEELRGRFFWDALMPPPGAVAAARWWDGREPAARAGVAETPMVARDGRQRLIHWTLETLLDERGEVTGYVATGLDVTEERRAQQALREERDRFNSVLRGSTEHMIMGTDPDGTITFFSPGAEKMLGYRAEQVIGRRADLFHDPEEVAARAAEHGGGLGPEILVEDARSGSPEPRDWTYVRADGSRLTVSLTITAIPGPGGEPVGYIGIADDVSARRRTEEALAASEYQLRAVLSHLPGTVVSLYDRELRCQMIEGASLTERGIDAAQFVGRRLEDSVPPENAAALRPSLEAALRGEQASLEYSSHRDETTYEVEVLPYEREGRIEGALTVSRDITQRKRLERELRQLAEYDSLSGLLNRRAFERELKRHLAEAARHGTGGALLLIDVDQFKAVNDTLGHAGGDELIVTIARILGEQVRSIDVAARLGGDEFAVLLPRADREEAEAVAERLIAAVRAQALMPTGEPPRPVTVSVGVAGFSPDSRERPERPLIEADLAMYEAKAAGGDGFRFRGGSLSVLL